jgi:elongation factor 1-beta
MDANTIEATLKNQQWVGGQTPTSADKDAFEALSKSGMISAETHPNVFAWFTLVSKFSDAVKNTWAAGAAAGAAKGGKAKGGKGGKKETKKEEKDDMDDLFGSDDDDGAAAAAAAAKAKAASQPKKAKKPVIAMSIVFLEVKPLDDTIDLDALAPKIYKDIQKDGLFWKTEFKKVPVAFGIFKLIVAFSCEDEKISVDDITEEIEAMTDFVQSCDIQSFNKI